jgi:hypothetical protein
LILFFFFVFVFLDVFFFFFFFFFFIIDASTKEITPISGVSLYHRFTSSS